MTALWTQDADGWSLLSPSEFPREDELHTLVADAPHLLPLAGSPRLTVLGREVPLGGGYADLIAVEPSGRMAVIEVKLARNAEARRAVIAQVLGYAAFLHGMDRETLEREVLRPGLQKRGHATLADAVSADDQEGAFDLDVFERGLEDNLSKGDFRLVLVLDSAPPELIRLVGYLEAVGGDLLIDLVTVSAYEVGGSRVVVPQRVDPERPSRELQRAPREPARAGGYVVDGPEDFEAAIGAAAPSDQPALRKLCDWAKALDSENLVRLKTYHGKSRLTLLPRLVQDDAGLVTIWNDSGAYLSLWRSVFERRASGSIVAVEQAIGTRIGNGNTVRDLRDEVLTALTAAYREAARVPTR